MKRKENRLRSRVKCEMVFVRSVAYFIARDREISIARRERMHGKLRIILFYFFFCNVMCDRFAVVESKLYDFHFTCAYVGHGPLPLTLWNLVPIRADVHCCAYYCRISVVSRLRASSFPWNLHPR